MKVTILGCGGSGGTPLAGGFWGRCDPAEPRNNRTRASILVESAETNILIDTSYDLREHLNRIKLQKLDAVFITHKHSDHTNGVDDLKAIAYHHNKMIDIYSNEETLVEMNRRWPYLFREKSNDIYVGFVKGNTVTPYVPFRVGDIDVMPFEQDHKTCMSLGFRFGNFAYSVDVVDLDERALAALEGVETWVVDAGSYMKDPPVSHANIQRIIQWTERLKPKMTYLTVLSTHMDYRTLCNELPPHIRPAYDGLVIDMDGNLR